jgi:hypothetical protein
MNKLYSAVIDSKNNISVFDVQKGVKSYSINLGNITIVNGPIITHDKLTIVVKDSRGKTMGKVYSLKKGVLSYSFTVQ